MKLPDPFCVPDLQAGELHFSGYRATDAEWVARLAGPLEVARFTGIPHPMDLDVAGEWVRRFLEGVETRTILAWVARIDGEPIGAGSLRLRADEGIARLGFWLGEAHWGHGYGRDIARTVTNYAFDVLDARRIEADCIAENVGSAKILESCGFQLEGRLRGGFNRFEAPHDVMVYGALRSDRTGFKPGMPSV